MRLLPDTLSIDFMRLRFIGFALSAFVCLGSIVALVSPGLNFGIDFRGGILLEVRSPQAIDLSGTRAKLNDLGLGSVQLQEFGQPTDVLIRVQEQEGGDAAQQAAVVKLRAALGDGFEIRRVEFVGPRVGDELKRAGLMATVLACLGIGLYIWFRFEWQFGVAALIALIHDVLTTIGIYALTGYEFNLATVAAVLTVAGYSINDTVVIFDRVRENARKYRTVDTRVLINQACNETLSRTVLTSSTTFIAVLALYLFGGEALGGFSFGILWGIIAGTYSSVLLACPLLLYMNLRRGPSAGDPTTVVAPVQGS